MKYIFELNLFSTKITRVNIFYTKYFFQQKYLRNRVRNIGWNGMAYVGENRDLDDVCK